MKKIIYLFLTLSVCAGAQAQVFVKSSAQQMVEEAVGAGLYVLRQEYRLEDPSTGKKYTWNNSPEFGHSISFCVIAENGYIVSDQAVKPWEYDSKYENYRDKYIPVFTKSYGKSCFSGSDFSELPLLNPQECRPLGEDYVFVDDATLGLRGFLMDSASGDKDGWLIWLLSDNTEVPEDGELSLLSYRHEMTLSENASVYEIRDCSTDQYVFGGIYVTPSYPEIGKVEYKIIGVVVKVGEKWNLLRCSGADNQVSDPSGPGTAGPEQLTESE